jgi:hypothetical protein
MREEEACESEEVPLLYAQGKRGKQDWYLRDIWMPHVKKQQGTLADEGVVFGQEHKKRDERGR